MPSYFVPRININNEFSEIIFSYRGSNLWD